MSTITEKQLRRIIKEEIEKIFEDSEKLQYTAKSGKNDRVIISPGLKVLHNSGIRYTVVSVSGDKCVLKTPEGDKFIVSSDELEASYKLD